MIGEAPGVTENATGLPFTGTSGRILDIILEHVHKPFAYTITNLVGCQPCDLVGHVADENTTDIYFSRENLNRTPTQKEIELCTPHITEFLSTRQYQGVVFLGKLAAENVKTKLPAIRMLHPAAISRMEYKVLTMKKQAEMLEEFLTSLVVVQSL